MSQETPRLSLDLYKIKNKITIVLLHLGYEYTQIEAFFVKHKDEVWKWESYYKKLVNVYLQQHEKRKLINLEMAQHLFNALLDDLERYDAISRVYYGKKQRPDTGKEAI